MRETLLAAPLTRKEYVLRKSPGAAIRPLRESLERADEVIE
jgi:hypothetical protein